MLIGTTLALFRKGRAKGGAWHDLEYVSCLLRQQVACTTKRPATEKDHGNYKIQKRWPIRPGLIREVNKN